MTDHDRAATLALREWEAARKAHRETGRLEQEAWNRLENAWKARDKAREQAEKSESAA